MRLSSNFPRLHLAAGRASEDLEFWKNSAPRNRADKLHYLAAFRANDEGMIFGVIVGIERFFAFRAMHNEVKWITGVRSVNPAAMRSAVQPARGL